MPTVLIWTQTASGGSEVSAPLAPSMTAATAGPSDSMVSRIGAELVGEDHPRHRADLLQQRAQEAPGGGLVPAVLPEDVQDVAVLVDGPPQVLLFPIDLDEDLVQVPFVTRPGLPAAQRARVLLPELGAPAAHRLVGDGHAALEHELLDLAEGQREAVVQPHTVGDDLDRLPVLPNADVKPRLWLGV
jgi:hypothetical protein